MHTRTHISTYKNMYIYVHELVRSYNPKITTVSNRIEPRHQCLGRRSLQVENSLSKQRYGEIWVALWTVKCPSWIASVQHCVRWAPSQPPEAELSSHVRRAFRQCPWGWCVSTPRLYRAFLLASVEATQSLWQKLQNKKQKHHLEEVEKKHTSENDLLYKSEEQFRKLRGGKWWNGEGSLWFLLGRRMEIHKDRSGRQKGQRIEENDIGNMVRGLKRQ